MRVGDARDRKAVQVACGSVREELVGLGLLGGVAALVVSLAVAGIDGVSPAVMWFIAGGVVAGAADALCATLAALVELRRVRRWPTCRTALLGCDEANTRHEQARAELGRCARSRHQRVGGAA